MRTPCTLPLDPPLYQLSVARNATQQLFVESRLISISLVKQWLQRDTQRPNVSKYSEVPQMFFSMLSNYSCLVNLELPWKLLIYLFCSLRGTMVVSKVLCGFFRLIQNCHLPSDGSGRKFEDKSHAVAIRSLENSRERNFQETFFFFLTIIAISLLQSVKNSTSKNTRQFSRETPNIRVKNGYPELNLGPFSSFRNF